MNKERNKLSTKQACIAAVSSRLWVCCDLLLHVPALTSYSGDESSLEL